METFNRNLLILLGVLSVVIITKLYVVADLTDNWRGFWYTNVHILIVSIGSYLALRRRKAL